MKPKPQGNFWCDLCDIGQNRVKASENLGATTVALVAPAVTSLFFIIYHKEVHVQKKDR
jgi:hypothetical protein